MVKDRLTWKVITCVVGKVVHDRSTWKVIKENGSGQINMESN